jgi:hypothetical protein
MNADADGIRLNPTRRQICENGNSFVRRAEENKEEETCPTRLFQTD